jgi:hypothetical protein
MGKEKGKKKKFLLNLKILSLRSNKDFKIFIKVFLKKLPFYIQVFYKKNIFINI